MLTALAFGCEVDFGSVYVEGIRNVSALDVAYADELGYRIKLLGLAQCVDGTVEQRVHPCMVAKELPIACVAGVYNAVVADGNSVVTTRSEGVSHRAGPTASDVVPDLHVHPLRPVRPVFGVPAARPGRLAARP